MDVAISTLRALERKFNREYGVLPLTTGTLMRMVTKIPPVANEIKQADSILSVSGS